LHKPKRVIHPITVSNLQGVSSIMLVRPKAVKEVMNFMNLLLKKSLDSGAVKLSNLEDTLSQLSITYRGLIYTNAFYSMFQRLDAFATTDNIAKIVPARYGKEVELKGIAVGISYNSTFPVSCYISKDADTASVKSMFYFVDLLRRFTDSDQMLYKEFGINPVERANDAFGK